MTGGLRLHHRRPLVAAAVFVALATPAVGAASTQVVALPAAEAGSPAVASPSLGRQDLFWTSAGTLRHELRLSGGSWSRPLVRGSALSSQPAVVSWGPGRLDLFARGSDNRLRWRTWRSGAWSGWRSLGGALTSAPTAAAWAPGRLDVFARGRDNTLYQRTFTSGAWSRWVRRGGVLTSSPAAVSRRDGSIDVVARTTHGDLAHRRYTRRTGWSRWTNLGGRLSAQPAVAAPSATHLDVFSRDGSGHLSVRAWDAGLGWGAPTRLGDVTFASGPGASAMGDAVVVAARRADGFVYQATRRSPTATWSAWRRIDPYLPLRHLGSWVDVLDYPSLTPETAVADMKSRGVRTLLLSTARFNSNGDFFDADEMGRWLDEAHAAGLKVVGWYVPAYGDMDRDVRRTVAIDRYVSPGGQRFDAIGIDIERFGASGEVDRATFNASVVPHLRQVRAQTTAVVAAIVPSPYTTDPGNNWEGFPWSGIGPNSEVVVPMALWSKRQNADGTPFTQAQVHDWVVEQVDRTQALTGRLVHVEGGVNDPGLENTPVTPRRVQAFVDAVADSGAIGGSHYDYATTATDLWPVLAGIN